MLSDRTKVVRGVLAFLAGCALLGLFMGFRGAMPGNVDPEFGANAPLATTSGVIVEAAPVGDEALVATPATNDAATNEVEEEDEAPEPAAAPTPAPAAPATPAPKEEAPPADPVGELIEAPAPAPAPPIGDLY